MNKSDKNMIGDLVMILNVFSKIQKIKICIGTRNNIVMNLDTPFGSVKRNKNASLDGFLHVTIDGNTIRQKAKKVIGKAMAQGMNPFLHFSQTWISEELNCPRMTWEHMIRGQTISVKSKMT